MNEGDCGGRKDRALNQLNGILPASVENLSTSLRASQAFGSKIMGEIPMGISNLSDLSALRLGFIPQSFGNLVKLELLDQSNNNFSGTIPKSLEALSNPDFLAFEKLNIMIDVAFALEYLHHGQTMPILHCDLKHNNVLLDKDMSAHVCDFGIAKLLGENDSSYLFSRMDGIVEILSKQSVHSCQLHRPIIHTSCIDELYILKMYVRKVNPMSFERNDFTLYFPACQESVSGICAYQTKERKDFPFLMGVESDCKEVIDLCSNKKVPPSDIVSIIADIRRLASNWSGVLERGPGVCLVDGQYLAAVCLIPFKNFNISTINIIALDLNYFSGHLPANMGLWIPNLEEIYLGHNRLSESIPSSISNVPKLTQIEMTRNLFTGFIPNILGNLSGLTTLLLDSNELTGFILSTLRRLENLAQSYLEHNDLK
ncbi:hypothetical protein LguiB_018041 [Lonicera macranthoides]